MMPTATGSRAEVAQVPPRARMPKLLRATWLAVLGMSSFFVALTLAYFSRDRLTIEWLSPHLASILSVNTALLVASSVALLRARQMLRANQIHATLRWIATAFGFGLAFLAGQAYAWRTLLAAGVYIQDRPNSAFFYLVTAFHAVHLLAGLALLTWPLTAALRGRLRPERSLPMDVASVVWHLLDFTWIYVYLALLLYR
jgi:cytochrome c oxidase subunit 3